MKIENYFISVLIVINKYHKEFDCYIADLGDSLMSEYENYEIVFVDNTDDILVQKEAQELLQKILNLRFLRLSKKQGQNRAFRLGLENVIGDCVVVVAPENDSVSAVLEIIAERIKGDRLLVGVTPPTDKSVLYRACLALSSWYCKKFLHVKIPVHATTLCAIGRPEMLVALKDDDVSREFLLTAIRNGLPYELFQYHKQNNAESDLKKLFGIMYEVVFVRSFQPLRIARSISFIMSAANFKLLCVWVLAAATHSGQSLSDVFGVPFFLINMTVLFLILGVGAEYAERILYRLTYKPKPYIINEENSHVLGFINGVQRNVVIE